MGRWIDGKLEYWNGWPTIKAILDIASLDYSNIPLFQHSSIPLPKGRQGGLRHRDVTEEI